MLGASCRGSQNLEQSMDAITSLLSALGLSTAAGLNAYIPLLVVGLLSRYTELINLGKPFDALENPLVLLVIAVLALLDFIGDKIPAVDHTLHAVGLIVAPIAGAIVAMAASSDTGSVSPLLAAICGVILAGTTQTARASARPLATATTAGVANPVISFFEDVVSAALSFLAILVPVFAFLLVILFAILMVLLFRRVFWRRRPTD
jgi:hypothetical protein